MKRNTLNGVTLLLAAIWLAPGQADTLKAGIYRATVPLGSTADVMALYSYPNQPGGTETLADTITHYTSQSLLRDGMPNAVATTQVVADQYTTQAQSSYYRVLDYQQRLPAFLAIGQKAVAATAQLKKDGLWNDKEWRMFLPLGLALVEQRSVQLLHFPPDYSLPGQDYLGSKTSQRWESLLEENGVAAAQVTLYEAIVDIAPIAAPASAGSSLAPTYPYFAPYARAMLEFLTGREKGAARPVVAYGSPVRDWVATQFHVTLKVLDTAKITLDDGSTAAIIGANHPSFIWYAKDQGFDVAEQVMYQDLDAACWQAAMGGNPDADPAQTVKSCDAGWHARPSDVCVLTWEQAFGKTPQEAQQLCQGYTPKRLPPGVDLERLEREAPAHLQP